MELAPLHGQGKSFPNPTYFVLMNAGNMAFLHAPQNTALSSPPSVLARG